MMDPITFVENQGLTVNEPAIRGRKWKKPLDNDGIYDPSVELELWQFAKLKYTDQIDYLLWHIDLEIEKVGIKQINSTAFISKTYITREQDGLDGYKVRLEIDRDDINPRRKINHSSQRNLYRYKKYYRPQMRISQEYLKTYKTSSWSSWRRHYYYADSSSVRPIVYKILMNMLEELNPKFACLKPIVSYYETSVVLGAENPRKFRGM